MLRYLGRALIVLLVYAGAAFLGTVCASIGSAKTPSIEMVTFALGAAWLASVISGCVEATFKLWEWIVS